MDGGGEEQSYASTLVEVTEGEWAGWKTYTGGDPFEDHAGPFYWRTGADGRPVCAFRAEQKHMNGGGFMHGGCIMTFADYSLFVFGREAIEGSRSVTATFNGEFVGPVPLGALVESTGEVVKAGRSMVFLRGLITSGGEPVMSFSAVIKKTSPRVAT
jgi:acyl-coenzyme A thioesterase PaaI-like protein